VLSNDVNQILQRQTLVAMATEIETKQAKSKVKVAQYLLEIPVSLVKVYYLKTH